MPIYPYRCPEGHTREEIRRYEARDEAVVCDCGEPMRRTVAASHIGPDGMYSYAPNLGDPNVHERRNAMIAAQDDG